MFSAFNVDLSDLEVDHCRWECFRSFPFFARKILFGQKVNRLILKDFGAGDRVEPATSSLGIFYFRNDIFPFAYTRLASLFYPQAIVLKSSNFNWFGPLPLLSWARFGHAKMLPNAVP